MKSKPPGQSAGLKPTVKAQEAQSHIYISLYKHANRLQSFHASHQCGRWQHG